MTALRLEAARMPRTVWRAALVKAAALPAKPLWRAEATTLTALPVEGRTTPLAPVALATLPAAIWVRLANAVAILNLAVERWQCIIEFSM